MGGSHAGFTDPLGCGERKRSALRIGMRMSSAVVAEKANARRAEDIRRQGQVGWSRGSAAMTASGDERDATKNALREGAAYRGNAPSVIGRIFSTLSAT